MLLFPSCFSICSLLFLHCFLFVPPCVLSIFPHFILLALWGAVWEACDIRLGDSAVSPGAELPPQPPCIQAGVTLGVTGEPLSSTSTRRCNRRRAAATSASRFAEPETRLAREAIPSRPPPPCPLSRAGQVARASPLQAHALPRAKRRRT